MFRINTQINLMERDKPHHPHTLRAKKRWILTQLRVISAAAMDRRRLRPRPKPKKTKKKTKNNQIKPVLIGKSDRRNQFDSIFGSKYQFFVVFFMLFFLCISFWLFQKFQKLSSAVNFAKKISIPLHFDVFHSFCLHEIIINIYYCLKFFTGGCCDILWRMIVRQMIVRKMIVRQMPFQNAKCQQSDFYHMKHVIMK